MYGEYRQCQKLERVQNRFFSFLNPLAVEIWLSIIVAYVLVSFTIWIVARFSPLEWQLANTTACISRPTSNDKHNMTACSHGSRNDGSINVFPPPSKNKHCCQTEKQQNAIFYHEHDVNKTEDDNCQKPLLTLRQTKKGLNGRQSFDTIHGHNHQRTDYQDQYVHNHQNYQAGINRTNIHNPYFPLVDHTHQHELQHQQHHNQCLHPHNENFVGSVDMDADHDCDDSCGENELLCSENDFTLKNSFWFAIGTLMQQGSDLNPKVHILF